ncbi:MAG: AsmA-like C-terminal domain-containing protein [Proteobacteria bacterium]|nr:AsmA-like C-terminal domain-containing protein [Pseudomonadota bacterium]
MSHLRKVLIIVLNGLMALVALAALLITLFVGRLMYGPLTTTSLTPWIEHVLSQPQYGITAKITQSMLHWDRGRRQVVLDLNNVQFLDPLGQKISDIPQIIVVLSPLGYFDASHSPWVMTIHEPQLHLRVDGQGRLRLGALQAGESNILEKEEETTLTADELRTHLHELATSAKHSPFGFFSNLTVEHASITLIDEKRNEIWNFSIPLFSLKRTYNDHQGSAAVHITRDKRETDLDLNLHYSAKEDLFHTILSFKDMDPALLSADMLPFKVSDYISSHFSGAVTLIFDQDLNVQTGLLNLVLGEGQLIIPAYYPAPLAMHKATLVANYTASNKTLTLQPFELELDKASLSGQGTVRFEGAVRAVSAQMKLSHLRLEDLPLYWPEKVAPNPRAWVLTNMPKGDVDEVTANIDLSVPGDDVDNAKLDGLSGTVNLSDTELRYWEPLPKLQKVVATSRYDSNHFDVDVKSGEIGAVHLKPSHVVISGLDADGQIATIEAHLAGPAQDILKVLNLPPLHYADKIKIDPALVSGAGEGVLKTSFPLINSLLLDQMNITADVKLMNVGIKKIADLLTVDDANVTLGVDAHALTVGGEAKINGVASQIRWDERFSPGKGETFSHGVANALTGAESAARFGVDFAMHSDPMPVTVTYDRYAALSRLGVSADAKKVRLDLPDVWYHKPAGTPADIQIALEWGDGAPMRLSKIDLDGDKLNVKGHGAFDASGKSLQKLSLDPFIVGQSKAHIDFVHGANDVPQWTVTGEALDIRGLLEAPPEEKTVPEQVQGKQTGEPTLSPLRVDLQVSRIITGDKTELGSTKVRGTRDAYGWAALDVSTVAIDQTPFNLSLAPQGNRTVLAASTPDLGNVLRALDVTDTLSGGKLQVDGKSEPGDALRNILGRIKLSQYKVSDMPFLVKLLSAISPDGLLTLGKQSLSFDELTSEYVLKKDMFLFTKANTATGTLGLTAAGKINLVNSSINMEGQVIPVVFISKIIGAIPLIGDILTGGDNHGLFAATYTVKGPLARPSVSVNPVSVLAPGIIRDILFTNPDIGKDKKK